MPHDDGLADAVNRALSITDQPVVTEPGPTQYVIDAGLVVRVVAHLIHDLRAMAEHDPEALREVGPAVEDVVALNDALVLAGQDLLHEQGDLAFVVAVLEDQRG